MPSPSEPASSSRASAELGRFGVELGSAAAELTRSADGSSFSANLPPTRFQRASVVLPERIGRPFTLTDGISKASIAVTLLDSRLADAGATPSGGAVLYSARDASVVHTIRPGGSEDHVILRQGEPVVRYRVELRGNALALRKVAQVVEVLDAEGAPRLRIAAPFVADARGRRHPVAVEVEGCHYDVDPRPPWHRALVAPGATACVVRMSWNPRVGMPALLDPIWALTGDMAYARYNFGLVTLTTGKVLAACANTATELYDPTTGTWALTGSTSSAFNNCAATRLTDGRVLLVSGVKSATYAPATGQWTDVGAPALGHAATSALLSLGKVLVAGGSANPKSAELFDPTTGQWSPTGDMQLPHATLTLTALPGGKVLAVSGLTAELYAEATATWTTVAPPPTSHMEHFSLALPNGTALIAGGGVSQAAEAFDPSTGTWSSLPSLKWQRWRGSAVSLSNGQVLVTGGWDQTLGGEAEEAERYVPSLNKWVVTGSLQYLRNSHRSAALPNGEAIVAGGNSVIIDSIDSVERLSLVQNGGVCAVAGDCDSAFCVGGLCCNEPCTELCRTCRASDKASGADGVCGFAKAGADPANQCPDQGALSCGTSGACDGAGACTKYAVGTACAAPVCQAGTLQTSACSTQGLCSQASQSCAPYACADGLSCGTSCGLDSQCSSPATCDVGSGKCLAPQANGALCQSGKQCASGACVDNVCCNSACTGSCQACSAQKKGGGTDGDCDNVAAGLDPDGECPSDSPEGCQRDGTCSGTGSCRLYVAGTVCGLTSCVGNKQLGSSCDGLGVCVASSAYDCGDYACAGSSCNTTCALSSDCTASAYCDAGKCLPRIASGSSCSVGDQCESGFCVDGVCCQTPCASQCAACDSAGALGLCVPVKGAPHGGRPACPSADPGMPCSAKTCDGIERSSCNAFVGAEIECRAGACQDGSAVEAAVCDGLGVCPEAKPVECAPYVCSGAVCKSSCTVDADCAPGAGCSPSLGKCVAGATCTGVATLKNAAGVAEDCAPFACSAGACRTSCGSIQDCAPGAVCSKAGVCKKPLSSSGDDAGCSFATSRGANSAALSLWLLGLGVLIAKRRRR